MILLIHGAWHGPWVWRRMLAPGMQTVDLDLSPGASLTSHVNMVLKAIANAASPVHLAGHSYGAAVAQIAAARSDAASLTALDGFLLRPGQSIIDLIPPRVRAEWRAHSMVPPLSAEVMAVNEADRDWVTAQLRPHPLACFTEPAPEIEPYRGKRLYIRATGFAFPPFDRIMAQAGKDGWVCETMQTGHDLMLEAPDVLKRRLETFIRALP